MKRALLSAALFGALSGAPAHAEFSGNMGVQWRVFGTEALYPEQTHSYPSISLEFDYYRPLGDNAEFVMNGFGRYEAEDEGRTNFDLRDAKLIYYAGDFVFQAGINKVFWGAAEGFNPVNIINQWDLAEDPGTKERLGQPMINLAWEQDWGTINAFVMPYFRERTFAGEDGRFRFALPIADESAYEHDDEERHIDYALRFTTTLGDFDVGLSHFYGTNRDPALNPIIEDGEFKLQPYYNIIHQTGLDVTGVVGDWLIKLEVARRFAEEEPDEVTYHSVGGVEYTLVGVFDSDVDLGLIVEYYHHDTAEASEQAFQNDVLLGTRWALNDAESTEILLTASLDQDVDSIMVSAEFARRLTDDMKLEINARRFVYADPDDVFYNYRKDSFVQADLFVYF